MLNEHHADSFAGNRSDQHHVYFSSDLSYIFPKKSSLKSVTYFYLSAFFLIPGQNV